MANDLSTSFEVKLKLESELRKLKHCVKIYKKICKLVMDMAKNTFNGQPTDSQVEDLAEIECDMLKYYYNVMDIYEFLQQNKSEYRDFKKLIKKATETQAEMKRVLNSVDINPDDEDNQYP